MGLARARRTKFHNVVTEIDGHRFASKAEARRYHELRLMERAGVIQQLELQPRFVLHGRHGGKVCTYVGDFAYSEQGRAVVEDVKGVETAVFKLKAKLFRDCHPNIELRVVR